MKRFTWLVACLLFLSLIGCTAPTQPFAEDAMSKGITQENTITNDLALMAKQSALDSSVAKARLAAEVGDPDAAQAAVEEAVTEFDKIGWLLVQHERALAEFRIAQTYIWSQRGILNILFGEAQEAKSRSDQNDG